MSRRSSFPFFLSLELGKHLIYILLWRGEEMKYSVLVEVYEQLAATRKHGEKVAILASLLQAFQKQGKPEWVYLLRGNVVPDYDTREYGISGQLAIKAISAAYGVTAETILEKYKKLGDLGDIAAALAADRRQQALFSKALRVEHVVACLRKILEVSGAGSVERKVGFVAELLGAAESREARWIVRTVLRDLRVGVADALLVDALSAAFFVGDKEMCERLGAAYDLANDFALVFAAASHGKEAVNSISLTPGKPVKVMLPVKVTSIEEAFEVCGKPAALEYKYDGFRMLIHADGTKIKLFTRKLEDVTRQFPDVTEAVRKHVKAKRFIIDSEVVGYDKKTGKYLPFEAVSQRIRRKHEIERLVAKLPVEINIFDILYADGKNVLHLSFRERRALLERFVKTEPWVIRLSAQLITADVGEAKKFYEEALQAGEEGIMVKALDAPYQQGRRTGFMVKLKPVVKDLDLVIVGADYGSGKRAGWLTSYVVACKTKEGFADVGMVSSGLKEKEETGMSYEEMTKLLKPLIIRETGNHVTVQPRVVVSVTYQNIQPSPSYGSGYALRFPRITAYRPERNLGDIATLSDITREAEKVAGAANKNSEEDI
jgi:DNA ligase-1